MDIASSSILKSKAGQSFMLGAIRAAEDMAVVFRAVTDDSAAAMTADRGEGVNRALERVENVIRSVSGGHFERSIIFVAANFAFSHSHALPFVSRIDE